MILLGEAVHKAEGAIKAPFTAEIALSVLLPLTSNLPQALVQHV